MQSFFATLPLSGYFPEWSELTIEFFWMVYTSWAIGFWMWIAALALAAGTWGWLWWQEVRRRDEPLAS